MCENKTRWGLSVGYIVPANLLLASREAKAFPLAKNCGDILLATRNSRHPLPHRVLESFGKELFLIGLKKESFGLFPVLSTAQAVPRAAGGKPPQRKKVLSSFPVLHHAINIC